MSTSASMRRNTSSESTLADIPYPRNALAKLTAAASIASWVARSSAPYPRWMRSGGSATGRYPSVVAPHATVTLQLGGALLGLLDEPVEALAADALEVVAFLEQRAERAIRRRSVHLVAPERVEGLGPIQRLADAGRPVEVEPAQILHERAHLVGEALSDVGKPRAGDRHLALDAGMVYPVVEAAPLERLVQVTGPVGGNDHRRRLLGAHDPDLRNRHLEVREELEQEGLELVVGAVELVDQQDRAGLREGLEQGPAHQELLGVQRGGAAGPQLQQLARVVPVVEGVVDVDALIALQADERRAHGGGQRLGELGLAHARLTLHQQRLAQAQCEVHHGGQALVDQVALPVERRREVCDGAKA